jgi:tetratricopeptide (TPR) repeat protein
LIWIVLALVCMPASGTKILDHSMASNIDESTNSVITRTYEFSTADSKAYSWLSLGNVGAGTVEWRWYSPDGNLYKTISVNIAPYSDGANWPSYNVWSYIDVAGDYPSGLPGDWYVDVSLDGHNLVTEHFSVNEGQLGTAKYWSDRGGDLVGQDKYDEAVQAYDKAIDINPQYAEAWAGKGAALYDQHKYDEAIQAFDKAIDIDPQYIIAWLLKGISLADQGKYNEAVQAYDKAIDINPQASAAWHYKSLALKALGMNEESKEASDKAKELGYTD